MRTPAVCGGAKGTEPSAPATTCQGACQGEGAVKAADQDEVTPAADRPSVDVGTDHVGLKRPRVACGRSDPSSGHRPHRVGGGIRSRERHRRAPADEREDPATAGRLGPARACCRGRLRRAVVGRRDRTGDALELDPTSRSCGSCRSGSSSGARGSGRTDGALRTDRTLRAYGSLRTRGTGRSVGTGRAHGTLRADRTLRTDGTLDPGRSNRSGRAIRSGRSIGTREAVGSGRSICPGRSVGSGRSIGSGEPVGARCPRRSICPVQTVRAGRAGRSLRPGRALRTGVAARSRAPADWSGRSRRTGATTEVPPEAELALPTLRRRMHDPDDARPLADARCDLAVVPSASLGDGGEHDDQNERASSDARPHPPAASGPPALCTNHPARDLSLIRTARPDEVLSACAARVFSLSWHRSARQAVSRPYPTVA